MHLSRHPTSYPTRWQEIAAKLEVELRTHYRCGDYLPAEQQLADRYEVNRHTLRRAIDQLVERGWVQRRQGVGVLVLIQASFTGQHIPLLGFMLTLAGAFSWACGNIFNKKIMQHSSRPAVMSLVVWSALIPIVPFMVCSLIFDGPALMLESVVAIDTTTLLSLVYLAFIATILGYGIWGTLLGRYETWRVAPLSLLVPVVGMASAALLLDEKLSVMQLAGAVLVMAGLYINVFGFRLRRAAQAN